MKQPKPLNYSPNMYFDELFSMIRNDVIDLESFLTKKISSTVSSKKKLSKMDKNTKDFKKLNDEYNFGIETIVKLVDEFFIFDKV